MAKVRYDDKVQVTYGMDILEQLALIIGLLGQAFIIYLFFKLIGEYAWWFSLGMSVSITTVYYYIIKYIVNYLHKAYY